MEESLTRFIRYMIWYKKTLKKTGEPIMVKDLWTNTIYNTDHFDLNNCAVRMAFMNTQKEAKACGATTVLEVYV